MVKCLLLFVYTGPDAELDAGGAGAVVLVDVKELKEVRRVGMAQHAAAVRWHPALNQIFVGIGEWRGKLKSQLMIRSVDCVLAYSCLYMILIK